MIKADGLDEAIVGVGSRCGQEDMIVYNVDKVLEILMQRDGMSDTEAVEFFEFNIQGSWQGEETPVWVRPCSLDEIENE